MRLRYLPMLGLLALAACGSTPAQQQAAAVCAVDVAGNVLAVAATTDPAGVKAVNSAVTAGATLMTTAPCQAALNPAPAASAPATTSATP